MSISGDLFHDFARATREAYARGLNCPVSAFDSEQLIITGRSVETPWFSASAATFGTGTVLCVDPAYREFVETHRPKKHYGAMRASFLQSIVDEAATRDQALAFSAPSLCFTICAEPPDLVLPRGFTLTRHEAAWMTAELGRGNFENGVGEPGVDGREFRNRFALVLRDADGDPAAVAGAFDTYGLMEIGIDVVRRHRGLGLGRVAVSALAREILREGKVPFYGCSPTNIRSQRTAAASGFRIVCSDASVWASPSASP